MWSLLHMSSTCGLKYFTSCINTFFYLKKTCILIGRVPIFSTKKISKFFFLYNQRFYRGTGVKTLASASAKNAFFLRAVQWINYWRRRGWKSYSFYRKKYSFLKVLQWGIQGIQYTNPTSETMQITFFGGKVMLPKRFQAYSLEKKLRKKTEMNLL